MIALCTHSFLEGTILAHPSVMHGGHDEGTLLMGIVLHKVPAALALMTVLACQYKRRTLQLALLLIFSLASPLGVLVGHQIGSLSFMDSSHLMLLFAFVAGNFLHISTTIFIESSPEHKLELRKLLISILGAVAAVASEFLA
jgi:zinc transporter ZupT